MYVVYPFDVSGSPVLGTNYKILPCDAAVAVMRALSRVIVCMHPKYESFIGNGYVPTAALTAFITFKTSSWSFEHINFH